MLLPFYNQEHIDLRAKIRDWAEKNLYTPSHSGIEQRARAIAGDTVGRALRGQLQIALASAGADDCEAAG